MRCRTLQRKPRALTMDPIMDPIMDAILCRGPDALCESVASDADRLPHGALAAGRCLSEMGVASPHAFDPLPLPDDMLATTASAAPASWLSVNGVTLPRAWDARSGVSLVAPTGHAAAAGNSGGEESLDNHPHVLRKEALRGVLPCLASDSEASCKGEPS